MKIGQTMKGTSYPVCRFEECLSPMPVLSILDQIVLELFVECQTQWEYIAGFGGAVRKGIAFTNLKILADAYGVELTDQIIRKFNRCVNFIQVQDSENKKHNEKK